MSETSEITTPTIRAINQIPYCVAHRLHAGTVKVNGGYMHHDAIGTPDILAVIGANGSPSIIYLETKTRTGKLGHETEGGSRWAGLADPNS